jgi:hypothetical protein
MSQHIHAGCRVRHQERKEEMIVTPIWICTQCFERVTAKDKPKECPKCKVDGEEFALWATNDEYRTFPRDWSHEVWWTPGKTFRAGQIGKS